MKHIIAFFFLLSFSKFPKAYYPHTIQNKPADVSSHVFIITLDGFRWQEMFNGIDADIVKTEITHKMPKQWKQCMVGVQKKKSGKN